MKTKDTLKILHFMPDNFVWGGIETYLKLMLPMLRQQGSYEIVAVVTDDGPLFHALKEAGVRVIGLPFPLRKKSIFRSMWVNPWMRLIDMSVYWRLLPILQKEMPDLVHIHCGRIEQAWIRFADFPMVYTYHGYGGPYNLEGATSNVMRRLYEICRPLFSGLVPFLSAMTVVSEYERQRLYREGFLPRSFKAEVLHNGLPTQDLLDKVLGVDRLAERRELGVPEAALESARVISYACRLRADRNPLAFLRIAKRVLEDPRREKPVYFVAAGDGKLAADFERAFSEDPLLSQHGRYLGFCTNVPALIKASDITLNVSRHEGFGLRVLESLLLGRPCVTYAAGGIPEVMALPEAENWLIPLDDEDLFVTRLIELINAPDDHFAALAPVLEQHARGFDMTLHVQKLEQFYYRVFSALKRPFERGRNSMAKQVRYLFQS